MKLPHHKRLSFKLLTPLLLCAIVIIATISIVTYIESEITSEKHVKQQAIEFSESFLIATQLNSSHSSIVRTTNSLATYKGIKELFIIDEKSSRVIAANKNKYAGTQLGDLPAVYQQFGLQQVLGEQGRSFTEIEDGEYVFTYRAKIITEDKRHTKSIIILMLLTSEGIDEFLKEFRNAVMLFSALVFAGALLIFYLLLKLTLLKRIGEIVNVIEDGDASGELRLCPIGREDELGVLVNAYNKSLLSDHEHMKELVAANQELAKLSHFDSLTGVSNRRNFDRVLKVEWNRGARHQQPMAVLMLDVDHFKQFNDRHGHVAGDNCLKEVAATLKQQLKRPGDLLSRYGGEEFSIILPNTAEGANIVAETCRSAIEKHAIALGADSPPVHITISIGIACTVPQTNGSPTCLLKLADQALYKAKENGRNQIVFDTVAAEPHSKLAAKQGRLTGR